MRRIRVDWPDLLPVWVHLPSSESVVFPVLVKAWRLSGIAQRGPSGSVYGHQCLSHCRKKYLNKSLIRVSYNSHTILIRSISSIIHTLLIPNGTLCSHMPEAYARSESSKCSYESNLQAYEFLAAFSGHLTPSKRSDRPKPLTPLQIEELIQLVTAFLRIARKFSRR